MLNNASFKREVCYGSAGLMALRPAPGEFSTANQSNDGREYGEIDVDVLLKGAENLCAV